ncbi:hypothetical protein M1D30_08945 [Prevotella sp. E15-22]|uniref:hypothetical protein n=1 Tax=Prevotella sp. E15-22 TaxID=2937774 RepID=UPI00205CA24F|nr:hypothetical protein [Prevotella sp. E15-22]UPS43722.1 hypothetical protein M1D30_08945 [Prevotella sp. E15-22]
MSPLASILPIAVFILLFYTFYIIRHNRKAKKTIETFINDDSYIESIDHLSGQVGFRVWQQYDVLLAAQKHGMLSIAGRSRTLNDDVKLVFYNQTRGLRLFTPINDETLVRKYVETLLRRTFGTPDAMKLAVRQTAQS